MRLPLLRFHGLLICLLLPLIAISCSDEKTPLEPPLPPTTPGVVDDLPVGQNPGEFRVLAGFESADVSPDGSFRVAISDSSVQSLLLIDGQGRPVHVTLTPGEPVENVRLSSEETALSLVMFNPLLFPSSPGTYSELREILFQYGSFDHLVGLLDSKIRAGYRLGDEDQDLTDALSSVYQEIYRTITEQVRFRARDAAQDLGPRNWLRVHTLEVSSATYRFRVSNGAKRWIAVYGASHTPSSGYSDWQRLDLMPSPRISILEFLLNGPGSLETMSQDLAIPINGANFAQVNCYGLGAGTFSLSQEDGIRAAEPVVFTVVFDLGLPLVSALSGRDLELRGRPADHPLMRIFEEMLSPRQCPTLYAEIAESIRDQDTPAVLGITIDCFLRTVVNNPRLTADIVRDILLELFGAEIARSAVESFLWPIRLVNAAISVANISWAFASVLTTDALTTFTYDLSVPNQPVLLSGRVLDADNNLSLADVYVEIRDLAGVPAANVLTNFEGRFETRVPTGVLRITLSKHLYFSHQFDVSVPSGVQTYSAGTVRLAKQMDGTGGIRGRVIDAGDGRGIVAAQVALRRGSLPDGPADLTQTTSGSGDYDFGDLRPGNYNISAQATGYVTQWILATVVAGSVREDANIVLTRSLEGQSRFVLTWGEYPRDLDSHLMTPMIEGQRYHVRWNSRGSLLGPPFANLDVDDITSYGPETVTIGTAYPGQYSYAVYQYSSTGDLKTSDAHIQLYSGSTLLREWFVPTEGSGRWWYLCDYNPLLGTLVEYNRLQADAPPGMSPSLREAPKPAQ